MSSGPMGKLNVVDFAPPARKEVPRDGRDMPMIVAQEGGTPKAFYRASSFVDCLEDKSSLATWKQRLTLLGAALKPSLLDGLAELGPDPQDSEVKQLVNKRAESAAVVGGANLKSERGTRYHELTEYVDRGEVLPPVLIDELCDMAGYSMALAYLTPVGIEQFTVCPELNVAGTFDRLAWYDGPGPTGTEWEGQEVHWLVIADVKTGSVDYGGLKMPAQLSIYAHSMYYDPTVLPYPDRTADPKRWEKWKKQPVYAEEIAPAYSSLGPVNKEWGLILHLRPGSGQCDLLWADLTLGWEAAKMAVTLRDLRRRGNKGLIPWQQGASVTREENE